MNSLVGQSLGRYHILEQLGEGGMAVVYKAFDTRLERDVAIKIIRREAFPPELLDQVLKRFEREAKALARLSHPNIVKVLDYGEHDNAPYLVLEYLPGGTLKGHMGKALPWQEAVRLLLPVARALAYAHKQNIIHRDVKPANVLMTKSDEPMLTDFGIAKILEAGTGQTLTGSGVGIGTPDYMAPEQGIGGKVDARADIYSLGIVFYELVAGRKPYIADTPMAVLLKHVTDPLPRPAKFAPDLPEFVENVIIKALAKTPDERYASMDEVVVAFEKLLVEATLRFPTLAEKPQAPAVESQVDLQTVIPQPAPVPVELPKPQETQPKREKKFPRAFAWSAVGILLIGMVVIAGWAARRFIPVFSPTVTPAFALPALKSDSQAGRFIHPCGPNNKSLCIANPAREIIKVIDLPLDKELGQIDDLAWAPDGKSIVLAVWRSQTGKTENDLFVFNLETNQLQRITNGENNVQPAWSPDGQWIAYHSSGRAMLIAPNGANQKHLITPDENRYLANAFAWSPDSAWLAWLSRESTNIQTLHGLMLYSMKNQGLTFIPFAPGETSEVGYQLDWDPEGRYIYLSAPNFQTQRFDLTCREISCADLKPEPVNGGIPQEWSRHYYPQWQITRNIDADSSPTPVSSLPGTSTPLAADLTWQATPTTGKFIRPCGGSAASDICVYNLQGQETDRVHLDDAKAQPIGQVDEAIWSPDGTRALLSIASLERAPSHDLYLFDFKSRALTRLTTAENNINMAWSQREDWIYYHASCLPLAILPNGILVYLGPDLRPNFCATLASWSPDGTTLAWLFEFSGAPGSLKSVAFYQMQTKTLTTVPWDLSKGKNADRLDIAWTPNGAALLVQLRDAGGSHTYQIKADCLQKSCTEKDWQAVDFEIPATWMPNFYPRWGR